MRALNYFAARARAASFFDGMSVAMRNAWPDIGAKLHVVWPPLSWTTKQAANSSTEQGAGKRRVVSPRDTRHASRTPHTGDAHARIGRVHNHNSRATTGPTPYRPAVAPQRRYEHKVKSRSNKAR